MYGRGTERVAAALLAVVFLSVGSLGVARADAARVVLNGQPLPLDPAPREHAGRVFVPLRAIFESLGASVVYDAGTINATRGSTTIGLRIGSTHSTVNGDPYALDVAPFIYGETTFVPLRFVASSLGASVDYDANTRIVSIDLASGPASGEPAPVYPVRPPPVRPLPPVQPSRPTQPPQSGLQLVRENPARGSRVAQTEPQISTQFDRRVEPNSVRVLLDGVDVTDRATRSATGIIYAPPSPLQRTGHTVRVTGTDDRRARFERSWSFTIVAAQPPPRPTQAPPSKNSVSLSAPEPDSAVRRTFGVRGKTLPRSKVKIVAAPQLARGLVGGALMPAGSTVAYNVTADANGAFAQQVTLAPNSTPVVQLVVTSTAPSGQQAEARRQLRVQK
jgi:hypothetical protein